MKAITIHSSADISESSDIDRNWDQGDGRVASKPKGSQRRQYRKKNKNVEWTEVTEGSITQSQGLQFITESGTHRPEGTIRNLIRSHARRKPIPLDAPPQVHRYPPDTSDESGNIVPESGPNRSDILKIVGGIHSLPLGAEAFDPFNTSPPQLKEQCHALVHHFDQVFRHTRIALEPRNIWVPMAFQDPVLMQATILVGAMSQAVIRGYSIAKCQVAYFYKTQTIALLNERLKVSSNEPASDATILAVCVLISLESLSATPAATRLHFKGLEALIKTRGGIQNLTGTPRYMPIWLDNVAAVMLGEMPRFDFASWNIERPVIETLPLNPSAVRHKTKLINLTGLKALSEKIMDTFWEIRTMSMKKEEVTSRLLDWDAHESYNDMTNYLERKTLLIMLSKEQSRSSAATSIFYLFSSAMFLNISIFLRDQTRGIPILTLLSTRIRNCLEKNDIPLLQLQYPEMMLWIIVIGGLGTSKTGDRLWFAQHLADACSMLGLSGGDELGVALQDFIWLKLYRTPSFSDFWDEVARAQGVDESEFGTKMLNGSVVMCCFNRFLDVDDGVPVRLSSRSRLDTPPVGNRESLDAHDQKEILTY